MTPIPRAPDGPTSASRSSLLRGARIHAARVHARRVIKTITKMQNTIISSAPIPSGPSAVPYR
jgi:hypothetical protein